jgi:hypothetical protein
MKVLVAWRGLHRFERGATRPGVLDILTVLILLAVLLWASWMQFPAYNRILRSNAANATPAIGPAR